jgi:spermidine synthase
MKKWTLVDKTLTPDGKTVSLHEHDGSYTMRVDGADLMSTRQHASEEKLAALACAHLKGIRGARVLIGGLGFGFTLRSALQAIAADGAVVVAEILAAVIAWNGNIDDPRVTVRHVDVAQVIRESAASFDSIILDVDNGPIALSTAGNSRLYDYKGLQLARAALRPAGCIAFWSARPDPAFARLMTRAGFVVDVQRCRSHAIFLGWHSAASPQTVVR